MKRNHKRFLLAASWLIFTTVLLSLPGSAFPSESWFGKIWLDKWIHVGLFAVMAWVWIYYASAMGKATTARCIQIALATLAYGVLMEFIQKYFIPNRSFDPGDIVADRLGPLVGLLSGLRWAKKNRPL